MIEERGNKRGKFDLDVLGDHAVLRSSAITLMGSVPINHSLAASSAAVIVRPAGVMVAS